MGQQGTGLELQAVIPEEKDTQPQVHRIHVRTTTGGDESQDILHIPRDFSPKEGTQLAPGLFIGKHIAQGLQGGVYDLVDDCGQAVNVVVKVVHRHALLAEVEREWEVGSRLNFLREPDGSLPGFMGTGAALRDSGGRFRGMILERLTGRCVDKVICAPGFADVRYIHDMLKSVFVALEHAQSWLGFHHSDLRLANVMEILLPGQEGASPASPRQATPTEKTLETRKSLERDRGSQAAPDRCLYQFKIIDYGLANFDETYACGPDLHADQGAIERDLLRRVTSGGASGSGLGGDGLRHAPSQVELLMQTLASTSRPDADEVPTMPRISPIEKLYRYMWHRKGDVYHLLFDLGEWLDGRVWHKSERLEVLQLTDMIRHVTGAKLQTYFCDDDGEVGMSGCEDVLHCGLFRRDGAALHFLRRWHVRLRSWTHPSNPGLTAAEVLTAPFFTKRISMRSVVRGGSVKYAAWTYPRAKKRNYMAP